MKAAWENYRSAPPKGTRLLESRQIEAGRIYSLSVTSDNGTFPILLVQGKKAIQAFVNACPHQFLPLDQRSENILSSDGELIRCSNHDAAFRLSDGEGVDGLGLGECLDSIPTHADEQGWIVIGEASTH
jgi:nitrite reductase/ring-hydroxylating ferredoxin subunit